MHVSLNQRTADCIVADCLARDPEEACGLLIGSRAGSSFVVSGFHIMQNAAAEDRRSAFSIDPAAQIALVRDLRRQSADQRIIGHYHSHPGGDAWPSPIDHSMASDPDALWMIVGMPPSGAPEIAGFAPSNQGLKPVPVTVDPGTTSAP